MDKQREREGGSSQTVRGRQTGRQAERHRQN